MKRIFDFIVSFVLLCILFIPLCVVGFMVFISSQGSIIFWSNRVGRNNVIFKMAKFRTMLIDTPPSVATHLLEYPSDHITTIGKFLRKTSIDELPQLWNILIGDMSFVGPRPALPNQFDLIKLRTSKNLHIFLPGLTGWAQVNGRDDLSISQKVDLDFEYAKNNNFLFDIKIIYLTFLYVLKSDGISH